MVLGFIVGAILFVAGCVLFFAAIEARSNTGPFFGIFLCLFAAVPVALGLYYGPQYHVWQQGLEGEAELKRAEQNRQIRIEEAQAKLAAAKLTAQAEVEESKGAAEANEIMAKSLGSAEQYLRWKYINMLSEKADDQRTIIYVPTEAQIPVLEAMRLQK